MSVNSEIGLLAFELSGQRYGLPLAAVLEVVRAVAITPLPGVPPVVEGAINVRGRVVPVLDLRARFGLPPHPLDPDQHLVLARTGRRLVAVRTDWVARLYTVAAAYTLTILFERTRLMDRPPVAAR